MNRNKVQYVISGAFALHEHTGIWRDTKDLDLFLPSEEVSKALKLLIDDGFHTEVCDPVWLAKVHRDDYFVDFITGMSNAALTVTNSWITRGRPADLRRGGGDVPEPLGLRAVRGAVADGVRGDVLRGFEVRPGERGGCDDRRPDRELTTDPMCCRENWRPMAKLETQLRDAERVGCRNLIV